MSRAPHSPVRNTFVPAKLAFNQRRMQLWPEEFERNHRRNRHQRIVLFDEAFITSVQIEESQAVPCKLPRSDHENLESDLRGGEERLFFEVPYALPVILRCSPLTSACVMCIICQAAIFEIASKATTTFVAPAVSRAFAFLMQAEQLIAVDQKGPGGSDSPAGPDPVRRQCVLCSRGCHFVSKRDRRGYFRFVPIQLAEGRPLANQPLANQLGIDPDSPDSLPSSRTVKAM